MRNILREFHERYRLLDSVHRRIAAGAFWVSFFVLIGRFAGAAREMSIAYGYGVSGVVDAFQLATVLVGWLPSALVAALSIVLVPTLVHLKQAGEAERSGFVREIMGLVLLLGLAVAALNLLLAAFAMPLLAGNLAEDTRQMAWQFALAMTPLAMLMLLNGLYSDRLMARGRQANTLLESVPAFAITALVLAWPGRDEAGPLLWGILVGTLIQTAWLSRLARQADGVRSSPVFARQSGHWHQFHRSAMVAVAGQLVMSCIAPLDQYGAARLGDSAIAVLGYATRISGLLLGIGAMAIARSALPVMADLQAGGEAARAQSLAVRLAALMLVAGAILAAACWLLAPWMVRWLFERGAFDALATQRVSEVFRWSLFQVPFYFAGMVLVQLLASRRQYSVIAWIAASNLAVKLVFNLTLPMWMGISGIALATGLMYAWSAGCLFLAVARLREQECAA